MAKKEAGKAQGRSGQRPVDTNPARRVKAGLSNIPKLGEVGSAAYRRRMAKEASKPAR